MEISRTERIRAAFGGAVDHYDDYAMVQQQVARHLADMAYHHSKGKYGASGGDGMRILEIGCGTGELTRQMLTLFPAADMVVTDIAPEMVAVAQERLRRQAQGGKVRFQVMDGEHPCFNEAEFDLILSSLAFQWFADLPAALGRLVPLLRPQGSLFFSNMADRSFIQWRQAHEECNMTAGTPIYSNIEEFAAMLVPYADSQLDEADYVHDFGGARGFLAHLRAIGATVPIDGHAPLGVSQLKQVMAAFDRNGGHCTYHIAYGHIIKNN